MEFIITDGLIYKQSNFFTHFNDCLINDNATDIALKFDDDFALDNGFDNLDHIIYIPANDWLGLEPYENQLFQTAFSQNKLSVYNAI